MSYNLDQQMFFFLVYGVLSWTAEATFFAVKERKFTNRGLLTLPINVELGIVFSNIAVILPTLGRNYIGMYLITFANLIITRAVLGFFGGRITKNARWLEATPSGTWQSILFHVLTAAAILLIYLLLQPFLILLAELIPDTILLIIRIAALVLILIDFVTVLIAVRKGKDSFDQAMEKGKADKAAAFISQFVWKRLEKTYPGIRDEKKRGDIVFAKGISMDKLVWVFLISALLGDIIETLYCGLIDGKWMNRSSVVFGPFSLVWGIGAVLLTVSLIRLKDKNDRWVFLASGILGGAFEYMCSVFTEIVFGKIFWDYSHMPLNIGGRVNVLFMFFWGILGLVWVKIAYPPLDSFIEKFPPIAAKVFTWLIVVLMTLNSLFTMSVMLRYNERQAGSAPSGLLEEFIDNVYNDDFVEHRWKNMKNAK